MEIIYTEADGTRHKVRIHNFSLKDSTDVRIMGGINLNGFGKDYSDKKWVKVNELTDVKTGKQVVFDEDFIRANTI